MRPTPTYDSLERYRTARHEAIHLLAGHHFGCGIISVDLDEASSILQWPAFAHEVPSIYRRDPAHAVRVVTSVICACTAPSWDERSGVNEGDQRPIDSFKRTWPTDTPTWSALYCDAGRQVRAWLDLSATKQSIFRLTQNLYVHSLGFFIFPVPEVPITQG